MPRPDELMDRMRHSRVFSVINLKSAYLQIPLTDEDKPKTAIITPDGHFQFNYLPFGLSVASQTMQRAMHHLFDELLEMFLKIFYDDLAVHSDNTEEHEVHLREVLTKLAEAGLVIAVEKCQFFKTEVHYLGHILSENGIAADPKNVEAVKSWLIPSKPKHIKQFLGAVAYYRRFIQNFSKRSTPLRKLLGKNAVWKWEHDQQAAFEDLRLAHKTQPVLSFFDPARETLLKSDASKFALGAVLAQLHDGHEKVVAYASHALTHQQQKWGVPHQECYAVVWAIKKFQKYLDGIRFILYTDHHSLCTLFAIKDPQGKFARWAVIIQEFDFQIKFKTGVCNADADCLSRLPTLYSASISFVELEELVNTQQLAIDKGEVKLEGNIKQNPTTQEVYYDFTHCSPLFVPKDLRNKLLEVVHGDALMGHGQQKSFLKIKREILLGKYEEGH